MCPAEIQCTARRGMGLHIAWQEACLCCAAPDSRDAGVSGSELRITRRTRENGLKALGVWITLDGRFTKESAEGGR